MKYEWSVAVPREQAQPGFTSTKLGEFRSYEELLQAALGEARLEAGRLGYAEVPGSEPSVYVRHADKTTVHVDLEVFDVLDEIA